jgi:hypothetical protein
VLIKTSIRFAKIIFEKCPQLKKKGTLITNKFEGNIFINIGRSNEILDWEGVGTHQLFCFFEV